MDKKLDVQLQVHDYEVMKPTGVFTEYMIWAAEYPDTDVHAVMDMLDRNTQAPLEQTKWAFVDVHYDEYGAWSGIEVAPVPHLEYVGADICRRCNEPRHLWSMEKSLPFLHVDLSESNGGKHRCIACVKAVIGSQVGADVRGHMSKQWRAIYRWLEASARYYITSVKGRSPECAVCSGVIVDTSDRYLGIYVTDTNGDEAQIHESCSFNCGVCNKKVARYSPWLYATERRFHDTHNVFGKQTCYECYQEIKETYELFTCPYCQYEQDYAESIEFAGDNVCESCYNGRNECDDCGTEYIGEHYCNRDNSYIHEYSYVPNLNFYPSLTTFDPDAERNLFFGFELEVECEGAYSRGETAKRALELFDKRRVYCKNDGSLDNGIEIVTHPHTLLGYQHDFNWSGLRTLADMGTRSWDNSNCGLHVHVSRKTFGICKANPKPKNYNERISHMVRFAKFFYDNERMITQIAGRESEDYASFSEKGRLLEKFRNGSDTRFQVVNSQPNVTLEVRIFKGSLRKERVLCAIELVHAVVEYTRELHVKPNSFAWVKFMGYLSDNVEKYPNLFTIMNELFRNGYSGGNN